ncbi:transposase-like protein [Rhizobium binae]|uniref:Transposase-like protein n=1 Tax=Rhizobium binae TaxID=1138190 RepID=A0ABV2MR45_9HYPH
MSATKGPTYERKRSDQIIKEFLQGGAVHIWLLDEAVVSIRGKKHWLWRAVDQDGFVLEVLVQSRRDAKAAMRLMRKLLKGQGRSPRVMITDKLGCYGAAKPEIMPGVEDRFHKGLNNRAENSHQPVRGRERIMKRFKSQRHLQRFVCIHDPNRQPISNPAPRHLLRPPSRTVHGGDEPVGENCPSMKDICGWRLSLAFHPLSLRCLHSVGR